MELHELKAKMKDICEVKEDLVSIVKNQVSMNVSCVNTKELGEAVDMIKDLAETEKACYESLYYETVIEAMEGAGEERYGYHPGYDDIYMNRMGYNRMHLNNGEFASKGSGHRVGYNPTMHQMPYVQDYIDNPNQFEHEMNMRNGYSGSSRNMGGRYGYSYDQYQQAKRYYTETHSDKDKREMDMHADEHVNDVMTSIRDIWSSADPEMRKRMKNSLSGLLGEMSV